MNERRTLLVEIGTEELPPGLVTALSRFSPLPNLLEEENLLEDSDAHTRVFSTPRRIAVKVENVLTHQPRSTVEHKGPQVGKITADNPKVQGFARSCGVEVNALEIRDGRLFCRAETGGRALKDMLPALLSRMIAGLSLRRPMRWGANKQAFARPVHWLCALHGEEVIPCELFGVRAGRETHGHRHHCPQPLQVENADEYEKTLRNRGHVIVEGEEREAVIRGQLETEGVFVNPDSVEIGNLLNITAASTEWPKVIGAHFDRAFLLLPPEVITQTLENALGVFPKKDGDGRLLAEFAIVADIDSKAPDKIRRGYENIVRARLDDARFFYEQDRKISLEKRRDILQRTQFQEKLGTLADKAERLEKLAAALAPHCAADEKHVRRAAQLCKCDLTSDLVGEYPKLQGIMGGYYAEADGEDPAVAAAAREHYLPRELSNMPTTPEAAALAIADRADTLAGFWRIGLKPSGSRDPYGLRRFANGILLIIAHRGIDLSVCDLVHLATGGYGKLFDNYPDETWKDLCGYMLERLRDPGFIASAKACGRPAGSTATLSPQVVPGGPDCVDAVTNARPSPKRPHDFVRRFDAVASFTAGSRAADSLIEANKRIRNILKKTEDTNAEPDAALMTEDAERDLFRAAEACRKDFDQHLERRDYERAMELLAGLREPVDRFFDCVMVMTEDEKQRVNRLALLGSLRRMFLRIADFSLLNPGAEKGGKQ